MAASASGSGMLDGADPLEEQALGDAQPGAHFVWVLKYKGNYKDICEKLGQDLYEDMVKARAVCQLLSTPDLPGQMRTLEGKQLMQVIVKQLQDFEVKAFPSPAQHRLHGICMTMGYAEHTCQPEWASGAHVFVNAMVANVLEDTFAPGELRKEHIIVSPEVRSTVEEAMMQGVKNPKLGGESQRFVQPTEAQSATGARTLMNPTTHGLLKELPEALDKLEEDGVFVQARLVKVGQCPSLTSRKTHTTGEQPRALADALKTWQRRRKNFTLLGQSRDLRLSMPASCDESVHGQPVKVGNKGGESECGNDHGPDDENDSGGKDKEDIPSRTLPNWTLLLAKLYDATHWKMLESMIDECCEVEEQLTTRSFLTTIDDVSQEQLKIALEEIVDHACLSSDYPLLKSADQFGLAIEQRMADFIDMVVKPFVTEYPIEHVLASNGEDSRAAVKKALKHLQTMASMCWQKDIVQRYLAGDCIAEPARSADGSRSLRGWRRAVRDSATLVAQDVNASVLPLFKAEMRVGYVSKELDRICAMQSEGPHAIADELKVVLLRGVSTAFSVMDLGDIARRKWREQKETHAQDSKPQKSSVLQLGEGTRVGLAVDHQAVHGGVAIALAGTPGVSKEYLQRKVPMRHKYKPRKSTLSKAKEANRVMFEDQ